jgi:hypothetical protein
MLLRTTAIALALTTGSAAAQTGYNSSYYMDGTFRISYAHLAINLKVAQDLGLTGRGVNIAVFDTGLDVSNPKFNGNLLRGWNIYGSNGQGESLVTKDNGTHGTMVSSIIAANKTPGLGSNTYGIAPQARIMPIQIFDANGRAAWTDQQFYKAIQQATNGVLNPNLSHQRRGIFNNSWNSSRTLADLGNDTAWVRSNHARMIEGWREAANRNILNVWAAGNHAKADPGYLATMPNIVSSLASSWIVVVATDRSNGTLASWSNKCGIAADYCMAAPGNNILGAYKNPSGAYTLATGSGTSYAAPIVTASAALIWEYFPYLKAWQVQQILFRSADKTGVYANTAIYGQGMLNLTRAFEPIGTLRIATTTSITGASAPIVGSYIAPGGVLEGPLLAALGDRSMMLLDEFDRGYDIKLRDSVMRSRIKRESADDLGSYGATVSRIGNATVLKGSSGGEPMIFAYTSTDRGMVSAYGQNVRPSLAYGAYANGVLNSNDLVLPGQVGNPYMNMAPNGSVMATSYDWGGGHLTRMGAFTNQWRDDPLQLNQDLPMMSGANIEHTLRGDGWWFGANLGYVNESKTLLGGSSAGALALGSNGASTAFAGVTTGLGLYRGWLAFVGANIGYTRPNGGADSVVTDVRHLVSGNAYAGMVKTGVFGDRDRFGIIAGVPLSVGYGRINIQLPTGRDEDSVAFTDQSIQLKPKLNEWSAQMFYDHSATDTWSFGVGVGARFNSINHDGAHEVLMMSRIRLQF